MGVKKAASTPKKQTKTVVVKKTTPKKTKVQRLPSLKTRGLVYISHLPHGFYEDEVKNFFKQFGVITNVQISRSKNTANCKGYGFVEFLNAEVAKIAAESMNNYIMFKKRLECQYVPFEQRPKHLFNSKKITKLDTCSKTVKREKVKATKNKEIDEKTHLKKTKQTLQKLDKKVEKTRKFLSDFTVEPVDVPVNLDVSEKIKKVPAKKAKINKKASPKNEKPADAIKVTPKKKNTKTKSLKAKDKVELTKGRVSKRLAATKLTTEQLKKATENVLKDKNSSLVNKITKTSPKLKKTIKENKKQITKSPSSSKKIDKTKVVSPKATKSNLKVQKKNKETEKVPIKSGGITKNTKKKSAITSAASKKKIAALKQHANELINDKKTLTSVKKSPRSIRTRNSKK